MKQAWIENGRIRDIAHDDPTKIYTPDIAAHYDTLVPDEAQNGDSFVDGQWTPAPPPPPPEPPAPPPPPPKIVGPIAFKLLFTSPERIAVKTSTDPVVQDFWSIIEDPRTDQVNLSLKATSDALDYLTSIGILAGGRKEQILTGEVS